MTARDRDRERPWSHVARDTLLFFFFFMGVMSAVVQDRVIRVEMDHGQQRNGIEAALGQPWK